MTKMQTFVNGCLRQILRLRWFDKVSNAELWTSTNQQLMNVKRRKWRWIGHTLRKESGSITRKAFEWNSQGKRRKGRPKQTWRRSLNCELRNSGLTWEQAKTSARDRGSWKKVVEALCSHRSLKE